MAEARERTLGWSNELRPLAPFDPDIAKAVDRCFNAYGSRKVERWELKTYADLFADFQRRPEYKYANAEDDGRGTTERRRVAPSRIDIIGKETIRYSRQDHIGGFEPAQFASEGSVEFLRCAARLYGVSGIAKACGRSHDTARRMLNREQPFSAEVSELIRQFVEKQKAQKQDDCALLGSAREACWREGVRGFAKRVGVHAGHLSETLGGKRRMTKRLREHLGHIA